MLFCKRETLLGEPNCVACCYDCLAAGVLDGGEGEVGLQFQNAPVRVSQQKCSSNRIRQNGSRKRGASNRE